MSGCGEFLSLRHSLCRDGFVLILRGISRLKRERTLRRSLGSTLAAVSKRLRDTAQTFFFLFSLFCVCVLGEGERELYRNRSEMEGWE